MEKITYLCFAFLLCISANATSSQIMVTPNMSDDIQRVRIDFVTPMGYTRHLLLGFTPDNAASDDVDYGYDGRNIENLADDMNWLIEGNRYVIQGVGEFATSKIYPLGLFMSNSGQIQIILTELENFETPINVYVFDAQNGTYTPINDSNYIETLESGTYTDRFYLAFADNSQLSIEEPQLEGISLIYSNASQELIVKSSNQIIEKIACYDVLGRQLISLNNLNKRTVTIPLAKIDTDIMIIYIQQGSKSMVRKILIPPYQ